MSNKIEGLVNLIGQPVILFCMNYFYAGKLVEVTEECAKLERGGIVYETGKYKDRNWQRFEEIGGDVYVRLASVEAFAKGK